VSAPIPPAFFASEPRSCFAPPTTRQRSPPLTLIRSPDHEFVRRSRAFSAAHACLCQLHECGRAAHRGSPRRPPARSLLDFFQLSHPHQHLNTHHLTPKLSQAQLGISASSPNPYSTMPLSALDRVPLPPSSSTPFSSYPFYPLLLIPLLLIPLLLKHPLLIPLLLNPLLLNPLSLVPQTDVLGTSTPVRSVSSSAFSPSNFLRTPWTETNVRAAASLPCSRLPQHSTSSLRIQRFPVLLLRILSTCRSQRSALTRALQIGGQRRHLDDAE
jgi:hypothetical protein